MRSQLISMTPFNRNILILFTKTLYSKIRSYKECFKHINCMFLLGVMGNILRIKFTKTLSTRSLTSKKCAYYSALELKNIENPKVKGFLKRLMLPEWPNANSQMDVKDTRQYCVQVVDLRLGLQWSVFTKRIYSRLEAVHDGKRHKWVLWIWKNILMIGIQSHTPGKYHFARKYFGNYIRLSGPESKSEIISGSIDSRYFTLFYSPHTKGTCIQHIKSGFFVSVNKYNELILVKDLELADNDWYFFVLN